MANGFGLCCFPEDIEKVLVGPGRISEANLLTFSVLGIGSGGGNGDIDTAETLAEWAR